MPASIEGPACSVTETGKSDDDEDNVIVENVVTALIFVGIATSAVVSDVGERRTSPGEVVLLKPLRGTNERARLYVFIFPRRFWEK
jgi:hypothetical protein